MGNQQQSCTYQQYVDLTSQQCGNGGFPNKGSTPVETATTSTNTHEVEHTYPQSVNEETKLMVDSTLCQLQAKQSQLVTFNGQKVLLITWWTGISAGASVEVGGGSFSADDIHRQLWMRLVAA